MSPCTAVAQAGADSGAGVVGQAQMEGMRRPVGPGSIVISGVKRGPYEWLTGGITYNLACPPSQDASHHQDYYIFSRGSL